VIGSWSRSSSAAVNDCGAWSRIIIRSMPRSMDAGVPRVLPMLAPGLQLPGRNYKNYKK